MAAVHTFRRQRRLTHNREYQAAYAARLKKAAGPLIVFGRPNGLDDHRLGLAVGRQVGPAYRRHRIKRLLREAFRLHHAELVKESGATERYDLVVRVRPHPPASLEEYTRWLLDAARRIDREHCKRVAREDSA